MSLHRWLKLAGVAFVTVLTTAGVRSQVVEPRAPSAEQRGASPEPRLLNQYCAGCHNDRLKTGGFSIEGLDVDRVAANADEWEKVAGRLKRRVMPPLGVRRPDEATYEQLTTWLEGKLDAAAASHPNPGQPVLHRLNRAEYANAIRDLLGLNVDVAALLPPDDAAYGFDNVADALGSSPALLQAYLGAARKISTIAVGDPRVGVDRDTYSTRQDLSQDQHVEGLPLGTQGGLVATHTFPVDGDYEFQLRLWRTNLSAMRGLQDPHQVEITLDGERILLATIGGDADLVSLQKNPTAISDEIEATRLHVRVPVKAGTRTVAAAFLEEAPWTLETARLQPFIRDFNSPFAAEGAPHVQTLSVEGPYNVKPTDRPPSAKLFVCRPSLSRRSSPGMRVSEGGSLGETACARRIVAAVGRRAYRRPLTQPEVDGLMGFYGTARKGGSFNAGVEFALRRILASPSFVFRPENEPASVAAGTAYRIGDYELASRLSFFLWSSIPDNELLRVAGTGTLSKPDALRAQVRRMLGDPKSSSFVENFAGQWLQLRNLRGIVPNPETFPDFDDNLRQAFRTEAEMFFDSVVHEDRSVLDLMTADDTFANERLAKHYGVPGVFGSYFRRVRLTDDSRRGLLGKGAVLMVTSHATTTSPVLRGKFVLDNLLGAPPPPPLPNVPALEEPKPGEAPKTMRAQMEQHRSNPVCANCHKTMDPIGFALENFDVDGSWRSANLGGIALDTTDVLADGTAIDGVAGLRAAILKRPEVFVQTLSGKLLLYAVGRGLSAGDMPAVRAIVRNARADHYRFSSIVMGIVTSVPFQMRMKSPDSVAAGFSRP
jgi:mono/diheme cytochrome c family protein